LDTIWKYELARKPQQPQILQGFPHGAEPLSVIVQDGIPVIYFKVDPDRDQIKVFTIRLYETGVNVLSMKGKFLGTLSFDDGEYILHVFIE
jgi:hypothetical protein